MTNDYTDTTDQVDSYSEIQAELHDALARADGFAVVAMEIVGPDDPDDPDVRVTSGKAVADELPEDAKVSLSQRGDLALLELLTGSSDVEAIQVPEDAGEAISGVIESDDATDTDPRLQ